MIEIDVTDDIEAMLSRFAATEGQIIRARTRALRKTGRWLRKEILNKTAKGLRIPRKGLARRVFLNQVRPADDHTKIWFGTGAVDAVNLGEPVQKAAGAKVGRRFYEGAFVTAVYTGTKKIWIRQASRFYNPGQYPTLHRAGDRGDLALMGRFPVVRAAVPIDKFVVNLTERYEPLIAARFRTIFEREINYEVNVKQELGIR